MPYARSMHLTLKPGKEQQFRGVMDRDVMPVLKQQGGFREELALVDGNHALGISVWDTQEHARQFETAGRPKILEHLRSVIQGEPRVEAYEVAALARQT